MEILVHICWRSEFIIARPLCWEITRNNAVNYFEFCPVFDKNCLHFWKGDEVATLQAAKNGFGKTGILPFNRNIFSNHKYTSKGFQSRQLHAIGNHFQDIRKLSHWRSLELHYSQLPANINIYIYIYIYISLEDVRPILSITATPPSQKWGRVTIISRSSYEQKLIAQIAVKK